MIADLKVMILPSEDGQDYAGAILYPAEWSEEQADETAIAALVEAQANNPEEWSWEDCAARLTARGFVIPMGHHGPTWDRARKEAKQ